MDYDREFGRLRQVQLLHKYLLLHIPRRMIVEIIQSNLAPGKDFGLLCQLCHLFEIGIGSEFGFVRMNSNGRINEIVLFCEPDAAVERARASSAADGDNRLDPRFAGAGNYGLTISIELLHFEMRVGIDEDRTLVVSHWSLGATRV